MNTWHWQWAVYCQGRGDWSPLPGGIGRTRFSTRLNLIRVRSRLIDRLLRYLARCTTRPKGFLLPKAWRKPPPRRPRTRRRRA